jgi:putative ABC transport system substrate-binding protein
MFYSQSDPLGHARLKVFEESLEKLGWTDGRNVSIEVRWSGADPERTRQFAKELLASQPDVIVTTSTPTTAAVQRETRTTPIIFTVVADPVGEGFVQNLARPGGNITGFVNFEPSMTGKWLSLLKEIDPQVVRAAGLFNPDAAPDGGSYFYRAFEAAARDIAITPFVNPVRSDAEIGSAISAVANEPGAGLVVMADSFMAVHRGTVIEQAARHRVPAVYPFRSAPADGGLLSYGPEVAELFRQVAPYVDRILRGAQPSGLPVQAPIKFELVINSQTAKSLGLDVPTTLLTRADDVIE